MPSITTGWKIKLTNAIYMAVSLRVERKVNELKQLLDKSVLRPGAITEHSVVPEATFSPF